MKAISLWQPWASLWLSPRKVHETRHWPTKYRGWLLVHAAKRQENHCGLNLDDICVDQFGPLWRLELPRGALIGMVLLTNCKSTDTMRRPSRDDYECGDFSAGRFAWERSEFKVFAKPIHYRGAQGFFNVPDGLIKEVAGVR